MSQPVVSRLFPALRFAQAWHLLPPLEHSDPAANLHFEENLLPRVGRGELGPCIHINRSAQGLAVTRREARMENFALASQQLTAEGWPPVVRASGGSCVPLGPGVISLALIFPRLKNWNLEDGYLLLCELLSRLLATYGLNAETGEVPGSFCDGRYNLQVAGKKLVGTAQRWAGSSSRQAAILAHACLLIDLDLLEATAQINRLYRLCGNSTRFDPAACSTLAQCLGPAQPVRGKLLVAEAAERLAGLVGEFFGISESEEL
jgi:lipoate-protein ligase A